MKRFDAWVGNRVAEVTAREVLAEIKAELELDFATFKEVVECGVRWPLNATPSRHLSPGTLAHR